jgi:hypothetical protein
MPEKETIVLVASDFTLILRGYFFKALKEPRKHRFRFAPGRNCRFVAFPDR